MIRLYCLIVRQIATQNVFTLEYGVLNVRWNQKPEHVLWVIRYTNLTTNLFSVELIIFRFYWDSARELWIEMVFKDRSPKWFDCPAAVVLLRCCSDHCYSPQLLHHVG